MNRLESRYDWIVLGEHPSALMCANLVSKLGLSVLCVPFSKRMSPLLSPQGQYLDPDTNLIAGVGTHQSGLLGITWNRISGAQDYPESEWIRDRDLQMIESANSKYSYQGDRWDWIEELKREKGDLDFKNALSKLESISNQYWRSVPDSFRLTRRDVVIEAKDGTKTTKTEWLKKTLAEPDWLKDSNGRAFVQNSQMDYFFRALQWIFSESSENLSDTAILKLLGTALKFESFKGGIHNYIRHLKLAGRKLGVHYLEKGELKQIFVENGQFKGIQIAGVGEMVSADGAVLGTSSDQLTGRIHWSGKEGIPHVDRVAVPAQFKMTIALSVKIEGLPDYASRLQILQEEEGLPLEMEWAMPAEYGIRDSEVAYLFVRFPVDTDSNSMSAQNLRILAFRALRRVKEIFPFFEPHITRIYPDPYLGEAEFKKVYGYTVPSDIPENLRRYSKLKPGIQTGIEGLFRVSSEAYSDLGNLGSTFAAIESTAWIAHKLGLEGPLV